MASKGNVKVRLNCWQSLIANLQGFEPHRLDERASTKVLHFYKFTGMSSNIIWALWKKEKPNGSLGKQFTAGSYLHRSCIRQIADRMTLLVIGCMNTKLPETMKSPLSCCSPRLHVYWALPGRKWCQSLWSIHPSIHPSFHSSIHLSVK